MLELLVGICCGCVLSVIVLLPILCYVNDIPLTKPKAVFLAIYLSISRFNLYRKSLSQQYSFRLSPNILKNICHLDTYSNQEKYPFITVTPATLPSIKFQAMDKLLFQSKLKREQAHKINNPSPKQRLQAIRKKWSNPENIFYGSSSTNIKTEILTVKNIECDWISHSNINININIDLLTCKGIIIGIHGGSFVAGNPRMHHSFGSLLSKLTGCIVLSIDYKLAPEFTMKQRIEDIVEVYKYLTQELAISSHKISCFGDSAGGGLCLLFIQYLNENANKLGLQMLSCCWTLSGWFNMAADTTSYTDNAKYDAMICWEVEKDGVLAKMALSYPDNSADHNIDAIKWAKDLSAINGKFNGLCPLYLMVGATELVLDDNIDVAMKAYKNGVDVKLEIEPYMFHAWPLFVNYFDEAVYSLVKGSAFINNHISKSKTT